jgi:hypothetical protein
MKEPNDADKLRQTSQRLDEFERRAERILDQLERAERIFDDLQTKQRKPDKATEVLQEVFEPIERGLKKLFITPFSETKKPLDRQEKPRSLIPERLASYLHSCSDEQLKAIRNEVDSILKKRGSSWKTGEHGS